MSFRESADPNLNSNIKLYFHDRFFERLIVRFIPKNITPNHVTLLRLALTPIVFYFIIRGSLGIGLIIFVIAALTDVIDGVMARMRRQISQWGTVYDPVSDKILIGGVMLILLFRHTNVYLAGTIIGTELIYIIAGFALKRHGIIKPATFWGKTKMVLQCVGVFFILLGILTGQGRLNDVAQIILGASIGFSLINLYKHGLGL